MKNPGVDELGRCGGILRAVRRSWVSSPRPELLMSRQEQAAFGAFVCTANQLRVLTARRWETTSRIAVSRRRGFIPVDGQASVRAPYPCRRRFCPAVCPRSS